jgi:hypothetical protein
VARELYPRDSKGWYMLTTAVAKDDIPKTGKEVYQRFMKLIVHKIQIVHDISEKDIVRLLRR